jgi:hypothetical protein
MVRQPPEPADTCAQVDGHLTVRNLSGRRSHRRDRDHSKGLGIPHVCRRKACYGQHRPDAEVRYSSERSWVPVLSVRRGIVQSRLGTSTYQMAYLVASGFPDGTIGVAAFSRRSFAHQKIDCASNGS